jgi:hypothetical protein
VRVRSGAPARVRRPPSRSRRRPRLSGPAQVGSTRPGTTAGRGQNGRPRDPGRSRRHRRRRRWLGVPRPADRRLRRRPVLSLPRVKSRPRPAAGPRRASSRPRNSPGWSVAKLQQQPNLPAPRIGLRSRKRPGERRPSLPGPSIRRPRRTGRRPQRCLGRRTAGLHRPVRIRMRKASRRSPTRIEGRRLNRLRTGPRSQPSSRLAARVVRQLPTGGRGGTGPRLLPVCGLARAISHQLLTSRHLRIGLRPQPVGILLTGLQVRTDLQRLPGMEQEPSGRQPPRQGAGSGSIRRMSRPARSGGRQGRGARRRRGRRRPRTGRPIAPRRQPLQPRR